MFRCLIFLLLIALPSTATPTLKNVAKSISLSSKCKSGDCPFYDVMLTYPQFENSPSVQALDTLNCYLKRLCDDKCSHFVNEVQNYFLSDAKRFGSLVSTFDNQFEIKYATAKYVSMFMSFQYAYPGEDNLHLHDSFHLNYDLSSGKFLNVTDCFSFKKSPQEWAKFVLEEEFVTLGRGEEMPVEFLSSNWGIDFIFQGSEVTHSFQWEIIKEYFNITDKIPKELYKGDSVH